MKTPEKIFQVSKWERNPESLEFMESLFVKYNTAYGIGKSKESYALFSEYPKLPGKSKLDPGEPPEEWHKEFKKRTSMDGY